MITNDDDNPNPLIRFGPSPQKNYGHTSSKNNHGTLKKQVIKRQYLSWIFKSFNDATTIATATTATDVIATASAANKH